MSSEDQHKQTFDTLAFANQKVALAGRLATVTHAQAAELIQRHGGLYQPRVTTQTTTIVIGLRSLPLRKDGRISGNLRSAKRHQNDGQKIDFIDEETFLRRLNVRNDIGQCCRTLGELADLVGLSRERLRVWWQAGLITPVDVEQGIEHFDYQQVVTVKYLAELVASGVKTSRLHRSLRQLSRWSPNATEQLVNLDRLGSDLVIRRDDGRLAQVTGQLLLEFDLQQQLICSPIPYFEHQSFDELFPQGCLHEESADWEAAQECYQRCLTINGNEPSLHFNLANVLRELGQLERAEAHYRQAALLAPDYVEVWINLGDVLLDLGRATESIEAWLTAIELDHECQEAIFNLADTLESQERQQEAADYWQRYLELDDESEWASYARQCLDDFRTLRA